MLESLWGCQTQASFNSENPPPRSPSYGFRRKALNFFGGIAFGRPNFRGGSPLWGGVRQAGWVGGPLPPGVLKKPGQPPRPWWIWWRHFLGGDGRTPPHLFGPPQKPPTLSLLLGLPLAAWRLTCCEPADGGRRALPFVDPKPQTIRLPAQQVARVHPLPGGVRRLPVPVHLPAGVRPARAGRAAARLRAGGGAGRGGAPAASVLTLGLGCTLAFCRRCHTDGSGWISTSVMG